MIDVPPPHLASLREILSRHVPGCEVRAFGSRVDGTAKPHSDLDLALVGDGKIPPAIFGSLKEALEASDIPFRVDILDWHSLSPEFQRIISRRFVLLSQRVPHGQ